MMAPILIYALAAAAFGGLDSVFGAALGGFAVGILNSVVLFYIADLDFGPTNWLFGNHLDTITAAPLIGPIVLLIGVLWFKPSGLFGTKSIERV